jgi:hypothetical protein
MGLSLVEMEVSLVKGKKMRKTALVGRANKKMALKVVVEEEELVVEAMLTGKKMKKKKALLQKKKALLQGRVLWKQ